MSRCRKHEPEWRSDNIIDQLSGKVRCKNCGMEGSYSNGQRKFGRPRRIIWYRHRFLDAQAALSEHQSLPLRGED